MQFGFIIDFLLDNCSWNTILRTRTFATDLLLQILKIYLYISV
jgi:hypothetical protein